MTHNIFPNAKPKLLGAGEDSIGIISFPGIAGLGGSPGIGVSDNLNGVISPANSSNVFQDLSWERLNPNASTPKISLTPNIKNTDSLVIITITMMLLEDDSGSVLPVWELKRGATLLQTINVGSIVDVKLVTSIFVDSGVSGNVTYDLFYASRTAPFSLGIPPSGRDGVKMNVMEIESTDTHFATITIPATATKQINTPDSHTTHETGVIP